MKHLIIKQMLICIKYSLYFVYFTHRSIVKSEINRKSEMKKLTKLQNAQNKIGTNRYNLFNNYVYTFVYLSLQ